METPKTPLPVTCQREKKIGKGAREQTEDFWDAEGSIKAKLAAAILRRTEDIPKSETNRNHGSALRICAFSSSFTRCLRKFCPAARILLDANRPYPLEFHNPFQPVSCWQSFLWYLWVTYVSPSMNFYFYQSPKGTVPSGHWPQIKNRASLFSMQCHGHATAMPLGFRTFPVWPSASPAWLRLFSSPRHLTLWKTAARCPVHICSHLFWRSLIRLICGALEVWSLILRHSWLVRTYVPAFSAFFRSSSARFCALWHFKV